MKWVRTAPWNECLGLGALEEWHCEFMKLRYSVFIQITIGIFAWLTTYYMNKESMLDFAESLSTHHENWSGVGVVYMEL
jgi:hypothetical protein